jgi:hypothetical protein
MIRLTITARDATHARKILEAVERVERGTAASPDEMIVAPSDPTYPPPLGHSYRELTDARRAGLLEAELTAKGLVISRTAFEAYVATRAERRRRKPREEGAKLEDLNEHRMRAIERAGLRKRPAR